jgi:hypothetical protein
MRRNPPGDRLALPAVAAFPSNAQTSRHVRVSAEFAIPRGVPRHRQLPLRDLRDWRREGFLTPEVTTGEN